MTTFTMTAHDQDGLAVIEVRLGDVRSPDARDELIVSGTEAVIAHLLAASATSTTGVALDIRTPDDETPGLPAAHRAAFIEACHGLVHAYVAEERTAITPVNLVVSAESQTADRELTLGYLSDADAAYTRGALIDLRSAS